MKKQTPDGPKGFDSLKDRIATIREARNLFKMMREDSKDPNVWVAFVLVAISLVGIGLVVYYVVASN